MMMIVMNINSIRHKFEWMNMQACVFFLVSLLVAVSHAAAYWFDVHCDFTAQGSTSTE